MSKKTLSLILTLLVLTIVLIFVAISANKTQDPRLSKKDDTTPTEKIQGNTILSMSPNPSLPTTGSASARTVNVDIDTRGDTITAVQLEVAYNPALLTGMTIKAGDFFESPLVLPVGGVNTKTGRISFQVTSSTLGEVKNGTGTVAVLSFFPASQAGVLSTPITILEKSLVSGRRGNQTVETSLLKSFSGAIVNFR